MADWGASKACSECPLVPCLWKDVLHPQTKCDSVLSNPYITLTSVFNLILPWINYNERTMEVPDQLHSLWWPSSENRQGQMMLSKMQDIHSLKYPRGGVFSLNLWAGAWVLPETLCALHGGRNTRVCVLLSLPLLMQVPVPSSSPTALLTTEIHCGKSHSHWARLRPLHTSKCIFQFRSVSLFSYNKVELLT